LRTATVIEMAVQQMVCTACGSEANASCNCGKPYVPKRQRAAEAIVANPQKSDRAIAADIGVDHKTVGAARRELTGEHSPVEREGLDGKVRRLPVREEPDDDADHEEGLRVIAARGMLNRATEAREIATVGKLEASDVTAEMIQAADDAAAAWSNVAQQLREMTR
jgi:hypothetical protein